MLTIFNRKELTITFSMEEQSKIRTKLQENNIDYKCKVTNRNSASPFSSMRSRTGSLGQKLDTGYEYIFFVYKKDYDRAKSIL